MAFSSWKVYSMDLPSIKLSPKKKAEYKGRANTDISNATYNTFEKKFFFTKKKTEVGTSGGSKT